MSASHRLSPAGMGAGEERFLFACTCGRLLAGSSPRWIEAQDQPELLEQLARGTLGRSVCPDCGAEHVPALTAAVHDPRTEVVCLLLPEKRRAAVVEELIHYLRCLEERTGSLPGYALRPHPVFGPEELGAFLESRRARRLEEAQRPTAEELARLDERAQALQQRELDHQRGVELQAEQEQELARRGEGLERQERELESRSAELESRSAELESRSAELESRSAELESRSAELESQERELERQERELERQSAELERQERELERRSAELERQGAELEGRAAQLESRERDLAHRTRELAAREQELQQAAREMEQKTSALDSFVEAQEKKAQDLEAKHRTLEHQLRSLETLRQEQELRALEMERRAKDLERLGSDSRSRQSLVEQQQQELARRQQELSSQEELLARTRSSLEQAQRELELRQARLVEREAELGQLAQEGQRAGQEAGQRTRPPSGPQVAGQAAALDIELVPGEEPATTSPWFGRSGPEKPVLEVLGSDDEAMHALEVLPEQLPVRVAEKTELTPIELTHLEELAEETFAATPEADRAMVTLTTPPASAAAATTPRFPTPLGSEVGQGDEPVYLEDAGWAEELDQAWDIELSGASPTSSPGVLPQPEVKLQPGAAAASPPPATDREQTRRFRTSEVPAYVPLGEEVEARVRSQRAAPLGPFERWQDALPAEELQTLVLHEGEVYLCLRAAPERLSGILERPLDLIVQLHRLEEGAAILLTLVLATPTGGCEEAAHWFVDHRSDDGREILAALSFSFRPGVILFDMEGLPRRLLRFERPLEANVSEALWRATRWDAESKVDVPALLRRVDSPDFDRIGRKQHPFHHDAFTRIESPAQARFALGVLTYWLEPDNRDYLTLVKSYPLEELSSLTRRILRGAVDHGIALSEPLAKEAVILGLARDERDLLQRTLASFAEVCLHIKPYDLDDLAEWENWEALLSQADACNADVDDEIVKLAELSMQRVQRLAGGEEQPPPEEGDGPRPSPGAPGETTPVSPYEPVPAYDRPIAMPPPLRPSEPELPVLAPPPRPPAPPLVEHRSSPLPGGPVGEAPADLPKEPAALIELLADEDRAQAASAALVALGREGAEALLEAMRGRRASDPGLPRMLAAFGRIGEPALELVSEEIRSRRGPESMLHRCLLALVRQLGPERLDSERKKNRRMRDAVKRAIDAWQKEETGRERCSDTGDGGGGRSLTGDLEALLGEELRTRSTSPSKASESAEIPVDDADILDEEESEPQPEQVR